MRPPANAATAERLRQVVQWLETLATPTEADLLWREFLRRFDIEQT